MSTADALIKFELPPRPAVLAALTEQMHSEDPDLARIGSLVAADVGLAASVIKTVNSPYFGLARPVASVQQAVTYLGLAEVFGIVTGALLKRSFPANAPMMEALWDQSSRRGELMGKVARALRVLAPDRAYTCGLFEDCGMALLLLHGPGYPEMLKEAPAALQEAERSRYGIDHAALSEALVRTWGLPDATAQAVRRHHELARLDDSIAPQARQLIALSVVINRALAPTLGQVATAWTQDAPLAAQTLNLSDEELEELVHKLKTAALD